MSISCLQNSNTRGTFNGVANRGSECPKSQSIPSNWVGLDALTAMIDKWSFLPILAFVYASIVMPLISFVSPPATLQSTLQSVVEGQLANKIFWPAMAASSVILVMRNRSRIGKLILPPHITCLLALLAVCWSKCAVGFQTGAFVH